MQMEGCITMGLGYTLIEDINFEGGDILTRSLSDYDLFRCGIRFSVGVALCRINRRLGVTFGHPR